MRRARAGALCSMPAPRRRRARRRRRRLRDEAQVHNEPRRAGGRGGGGREAAGGAALRRLRTPAETRGFAARYGAPFCGSRSRPLTRRLSGAGGAVRRAVRGALPPRDGRVRGAAGPPRPGGRIGCGREIGPPGRGKKAGERRRRAGGARL